MVIYHNKGLKIYKGLINNHQHRFRVSTNEIPRVLVNLYFTGGYQNNSEIDIFHEKEPMSIGLFSTSRIRKRLLDDTRRLHEEGHHEAPPGGADRPQP
jgi:hypothetical protein